MANITLLPSAKVPLVYDGDNTMTTEWYRFFWNIYGFTGTGVVPVDKGGTGLNTIGDHQLIIGNTNNVFEPALLSSSSIAITYPAGFINLELGASGITPGTYGSASQVGVFTVNQYGVLTAAFNTSIGIDASQIVSGTLPVIRGGTGQSTYTDGQLLIGNTTGNTLTKATLTAGTGISVSNGAGSITIANTGVLSVSGTAPVVSSGGATPTISMAAANTTTNGYLTSTDWNTFNNKAPATSGTSILYGNGSGGFSNVTIGSGISFAGGTLSATGSGGTVTSVSGTGTVNGITLTGTVTSSGSLTLGGTLSGIGNSQLTNSTISGVALGGNLFSLTAGTGVSFSTGTTYNGSAAITINATGSGGTVTSVAALTLGTTGTDLSSTVANSTTTPVITLNVPTASATNRGALSAADWSTFNSKQAALVSGTNIKTVGGVSLLGSGDVGTIGATYGGTGQSSYAVGDILYASTTTALSKLADVATGNALISGGVGVAPSYGKIGLTTHISGTLAVGNGGTGLTSLTQGYIPFGTGTTAFGSTSNLFWDNTNNRLGVNITPSYSLDVSGISRFSANFLRLDCTGFSGMYYIYNASGDGYFGVSNATNGLLTTSAAGDTCIRGSQKLIFGIAGAGYMQIASSGGVSIGNTTDPGATNLGVTGIITQSTTLAAYLWTNWNPTDNTGTSTVPSTGNNYDSTFVSSTFSAGTTTTTFNKAGKYLVSIMNGFTAGAAYTYSRRIMNLGGTATRYLNLNGPSANGDSSISSNYNVSTNFYVVATAGQTITIQPTLELNSASSATLFSGVASATFLYCGT